MTKWPSVDGDLWSFGFYSCSAMECEMLGEIRLKSLIEWEGGLPCFNSMPAIVAHVFCFLLAAYCAFLSYKVGGVWY